MEHLQILARKKIVKASTGLELIAFALALHALPTELSIKTHMSGVDQFIDFIVTGMRLEMTVNLRSDHRS